MTKQKIKYNLGMAGEFFVAAQLQRFGLSASVTYGNAKKADVITVSEKTGKAIIIEVKSTSQKKWVIGNYVPENFLFHRSILPLLFCCGFIVYLSDQRC